jgi:FkbM family methyltransferase
MSHPLKLLSELRLAPPQGIIHVGANFGQEISAYRSSGAQICLYFEPIPAIFEKLKSNLENIPNHYALQELISDKDDEEVVFNITNNSLSSSMLPLGKHSVLYPNIKYVKSLSIKTKTLDGIIEKQFSAQKFDALIIDVQGAEIKVLNGAKNLLKSQLTYIYAEVSEEPLYEGGCTFDEVTEFLKSYGFRLKNLSMNDKNWGNALYVKNTAREKSFRKPPGKNLALKKPAKQSSVSKWSKPNDASGGVNGIKNGSFGFHTDTEVNPWWQVDLLDVYKLTEIWIYNRVNSRPERSRTLRVLLSLDGRDWKLVYANNHNVILGGIYTEPLIVSLDSIAARYVRLQLAEENFLHLDEVEVYGDILD